MMTTATALENSATTSAPTVTKGVLAAAWAVPAMVLGGFALLSGIPLAVVVTSALRTPGATARRWWSAALATAYLIPLGVWQFGPSEAPSLTKFLSPAATAALVGTGVVVALAHHLLRRRGR